MTDLFADLLKYPWLSLPLAFILGAIVGSFLNVCIARLPLEKSILWPGSRCGNCFQPIRWYDNIPLLSYWRLRGRCRTCGKEFSSRYFWVEFLTAAGFVLLLWLEVYQNIRRVPIGSQVNFLGIWLYHAIFLALLIVVTFTDIDYREIPLGVTVTGTIIGIIGGTLAPWPWPLSAESISPVANAWPPFAFGGLGPGDVFPLPVGLQMWPVWMPAPDWMPPGSWQMGFMTSAFGAFFGAAMIRLIRLIFSWAFAKEAMGLGDADLMMMIGAFLGWQSFFFVLGLGVVLGLLYAVLLWVKRGESELAFGPYLAGGAVLTMALAYPLGAFQRLFFDLGMIVTLAVLGAAIALIMSMAIRMARLIFQAT